MVSVNVRNFLFISTLLVALAGFSSCKFTAPTVTGLKGVSVVPSDSGKIALDLELRIRNPNTFGFRLKKIESEISMDGKVIGYGKGREKLRIRKLSEDYHKVRIETNLNTLQLASSSLFSLFSSGKTELGVKGQGKATVFIFSRKFSFEQSENFDFRKMF